MIDDTKYKGYLKKLGFYILFFTGMRIGERLKNKIKCSSSITVKDAHT